jgi:hypothetical protein
MPTPKWKAQAFFGFCSGGVLYNLEIRMSP